MTQNPSRDTRDTITLAEALRRAAGELDLQQPPAQLQGRIAAAASHARLAAGRAPLTAPAPRAVGLVPAGATAAGAADPREAARRHRGWAWSGAALCATVLAASALLMLRAPGLAEDGLRPGGFLALVPPERWPEDMAGRAAPAWLVQAELSGERLAAMGLPYDPASPGRAVRAELLMNASGQVLAVRFPP